MKIGILQEQLNEKADRRLEKYVSARFINIRDIHRGLLSEYPEANVDPKKPAFDVVVAGTPWNAVADVATHHLQPVKITVSPAFWDALEKAICDAAREAAHIRETEDFIKMTEKGVAV